MKKLISFFVGLMLFSSFLLGGEWNLGYQFIQPLSDGLEVIHLNNNQVLVCADYNWYIIDTITNQLVDSDLLDYPIERAAYAWLNEEEIMIIGGYWEGNLIADCQVLNIISRTCYTLPHPMNYGRFYHCAGRISGGIYDGYIIAGGGYGTAIGATWERFDPNTQEWTEIADCPVGRRDFNLNICSNGKMVTSAGQSITGIITVYDANTNSWTEIPCDIIFGESSASTNINEAKVFITCGQIFGPNHGYSNEWLIFDINSLTVIANGIYPIWFPARAGTSVECLANGKIMISSGVGSDYGLYSCASFDSNTLEWTSEAETNYVHFTNTCLTTDNRIFLASANPYAFTEIYSWNTSPWVSVLNTPESGFTGQDVNYEMTLFDSEHDSLSIRLNYNYPDTTAITEWSEFVPYNSIFEMTHNWNTSGTYDVYIQTKDIWEPMGIHNSLSDWSSLFSIVISDSTSFEENEIALPVNLSNHPNPFNPSTTISFSVAQNSDFVNLEIFNIKGQKIKTLVHNEFTKGSHSIIWNGDDESGNNVSSGVYLYKLKVNGKMEAVRKCILLK